jgi:hypothetical protein
MIFFWLFVPLIVLAQDFRDQSLTVGMRSSYFTHDGKAANTFLYYVPEYADETLDDAISTRRKFKLRVFDYVSSDERIIIDPLDVSLEWFTDRNSFQVGFVRYRFSETFGVQFLDVANPRDYSEFIFNDLSWAKRAVFGLNDTYKFSSFELQGILTLWPNGDRLPYQRSPFDPTGGQLSYQGGVQDRPWFQNPEYGVRLRKLFDSGLDASLLYFHHFSRPTFFDVELKTPEPASLSRTNTMVDSLGLSGSYVLEDWVVRSDLLMTHKDLIQEDALKYKKANHYQALLGIDRTIDEFVVGLQSQSDFSIQRHFAGVRSEWSRYDTWKPSFMYFRNYKETDEWLQLRNTFFWKDLRLEVVWDNFNGGRSEREIFGFFRQNDRFLFDMSLQY